MAQTPPSLLQRIRDNPTDADAWHRFDDLYRPLLSSWLRRYSIQPTDADDLIQELFQTVLKELPRFHYDPKKGRFRAWLRAILVNKLRRFWRSQKSRPDKDAGEYYQQVLSELEDPKSALSRLWDQEHDQNVAQRLLESIKPEFPAAAWQAFQKIMEGQRPAQIAKDLKISANQVYLAKSNILKRLRQELEELTD